MRWICGESFSPYGPSLRFLAFWDVGWEVGGVESGSVFGLRFVSASVVVAVCAFGREGRDGVRGARAAVGLWVCEMFVLML